MGRPRSFDETELLETVMEAFWRHGYPATTYRSLETMSGVGVRSLANTFGDKVQLFHKALVRYRERVADNLETMFDPPSIDSIIGAFERMSSPVDRDNVRRSGCLMVNTGFQIEHSQEPIVTELALYQDLWRTNFQKALEADRITNAEEKAEFLLGALWGALSQIHLARDTTAAQPMTIVLTETIRRWTPSDSTS